MLSYYCSHTYLSALFGTICQKLICSPQQPEGENAATMTADEQSHACSSSPPLRLGNNRLGASLLVAKRMFRSEVAHRRRGMSAELSLEEVWGLSFWFLSTGESSVVCFKGSL